MNRFPCLKLAIDLVQEGGNSIPVMSIANDHVVDLFLNDKIRFLDIPKTIEKTVKKFQSKEKPNTEDLIQLNQEIKVYLGSN
jgi:1-deoxy-D-xylulose-5-phosphate reductoisomerase